MIVYVVKEKHSRAGSRAKNICTRSQNVSLLTGNVSTDDMVRCAAKEVYVNLKKKGVLIDFDHVIF
jgi:hypothetical protein